MPRTRANMGIKKWIVVKNWHFHPIFSHWFQFYYRMAGHNPVFHDDLKTRINLGAAREIRIFLDPKNGLKWFSFQYFMFHECFSTHEKWATTTPLCLNRHSSPSGLLLYQHKGSEKSKDWPPYAANTCEHLFGRKGLSKKCTFFYLFLTMVFIIAPKQSIVVAFFIFFHKQELKFELLVKSASQYPYFNGNYDFCSFSNFLDFWCKSYLWPPALG